MGGGFKQHCSFFLCVLCACNWVPGIGFQVPVKKTKETSETSVFIRVNPWLISGWGRDVLLLTNNFGILYSRNEDKKI